MKAIRLEQGTMGNYRVFVDDQEVDLQGGIVLDAEDAILAALTQQGINITLSTKSGNYKWTAPYWQTVK